MPHLPKWSRPRWPTRPRLRHPAQVLVSGFASAVIVGTFLLALPAARTEPAGGSVLTDALFTATSAVCVTGLVVVDTAAHWSPFGLGVIIALIQVGGFGIMTFASLVGLLLVRRMGLRSRLSAAAETKSLEIGDVRRVLLGVAKIGLTIEALTALALTLRFALAYDEPIGRAVWLGGFHAVSAFNNAGFALFSDSLMGYVSDPWICLPVIVAVILGGLGFPVLLQLRHELRARRRWNMSTKVVLWTTALLLVGGTATITGLEWSNPETLGALPAPDRLLAGLFQAVMPRTAGFNTIDTAAMEPSSWLVTDVLMFIGGGPAGTAGGIKVTTFAVLFFIIYTEVRGEGAVNVFGKRLPRSVQRQALAVALLSVAAIIIPTVILMVISDFGLDATLFEVISAFATVGLSTGITAKLPQAGQLLLVALMFVGRLGPITVASALALRSRTRLYELPKERPIIG